MSLGSGQGEEIKELEKDAQSLSKENLSQMMKVDELLGELESELENADQLVVKQAKQEEKGNSNTRRMRKEVQLDKNIEGELKDAFERILKAKDEIEDIIAPLKNTQEFALVAGFAAEIGRSGSPSNELMDEIDTALHDEFGDSYSRERMAEIGEWAENLDSELIDARQKLKEAAQELEDVLEKEREEIEAEENDTLKKEEEEVHKIVEDVIGKIKKLSNFEASRRDLEQGSSSNTKPLDRFIGTLSLLGKLSEYEVNQG